MATNDIVDESAVHVAKHTGGEFFCDNSGADGGSGVITSVGLVVGYPVLFNYFSQLGDGVLGH